jgi:hypothetical protein
VNATTTHTTARRPPPQENVKILGDCRDLALQRLLPAFATLLDHAADMLLDRASRTDVREEQQLYLDARAAIVGDRAPLMRDLEQEIRREFDDRVEDRHAVKADFRKLDVSKLALVDTSTMDETVVTGNIKRVLENLCHDELRRLNRAFGYLLGRTDLETDANPLAPAALVDAFAAALRKANTAGRVNFAILKEINQGSLGEINTIYSEVNKHLTSLHVVPAALKPSPASRGAPAERSAGAPADHAAEAGSPQGAAGVSGEIDLMALFNRRFGAAPAGPAGAMPGAGAAPGAWPGGASGTGAVPGGGGVPAGGASGPWTGGAAGGVTGAMAGPGGAAGPWTGGPRAPTPGGGVAFAGGGGGPGGGGGGFAAPAGGFAPASPDTLPQIEAPFAPSPWIPQGPLPPTPSGYRPGMPIIATPALGEGLSRLQAGESGFDLGGGALVQFSGIPQGTQNVLRELAQSPLGKRTTQLEAMTIELVAMLFDFIFETKDLPDGIKALLARLQIPVLKAAMLDGEFFAKKTHPSRLLVNALAEAGRGWSHEMGVDDPLYRRIEDTVHRVLEGFTDDLSIFDELREALARFLAAEEEAAEENIRSTAEEIQDVDRQHTAAVMVRAELDRRLTASPVPTFLAEFLQQQWRGALERIYVRDGDASEGWSQALATLDDLVWSVQPKRSTDDRKHLVALLPSLLKRMSDGLQQADWPVEGRERFMANLVEAHAAAVKPSLASVALPTTAVAEQAKADAAQAKAAGDDVAAARAEQLAAAMSPAPPPVPEAAAEVIADQFLEIAQSIERGMWIEFEADDGQLVFAKLAWVSPLRGTYLFTNRQGQKALSMTAEELAQRFRSDTARLVEAEPLIDRAFSSVLSRFDEQLVGAAA